MFTLSEFNISDPNSNNSAPSIRCRYSRIVLVCSGTVFSNLNSSVAMNWLTMSDDSFSRKDFCSSFSVEVLIDSNWSNDDSPNSFKAAKMMYPFVTNLKNSRQSLTEFLTWNRFTRWTTYIIILYNFWTSWKESWDRSRNYIKLWCRLSTLFYIVMFKVKDHFATLELFSQNC